MRFVENIILIYEKNNLNAGSQPAYVTAPLAVPGSGALGLYGTAPSVVLRSAGAGWRAETLARRGAWPARGNAGAPWVRPVCRGTLARGGVQTACPERHFQLEAGVGIIQRGPEHGPDLVHPVKHRLPVNVQPVGGLAGAPRLQPGQ